MEKMELEKCVPSRSGSVDDESIGTREAVSIR